MLPNAPKFKRAKSFFYHGTLPPWIDEKQPPETKRPFSTIQKTPWAHTMHLVMPEKLLDAVQIQLNERSTIGQYAKVMMSLSEILSGEFFNHYIKRGNISMRSEGRHMLDHVYSLREGMLRIELDRPTYERTGLVGTSIRDGGPIHKKSRFRVFDHIIEIDLRSPSMLHGKKGFERIVSACKNVLTGCVTWLFVDHVSTDPQSESLPIRAHHPRWVTIQPRVLRRSQVLCPEELESAFYESYKTSIVKDGEFVQALEEWLSLVTMGSSRVTSADKPDPYICRYQIPSTSVADSETPQSPQELVCLRLHGFLTSSCMLQIFMIMTKVCRSSWSSLSWNGFSGDSSTILQLPQYKATQEYLQWDVGIQ